MSHWPEHIAGETRHARRGSISNAFRYGVDYVLIDPASDCGPGLFSRNGFNLASVNDASHGSLKSPQKPVEWVSEIITSAGVPFDQLLLLTQPRFLGYIFNPVSFWLAMRDNELLAVVAEVNNPFGDRHSYICVGADREPITASTKIAAEKVMHVSPYQSVEGDYAFTFDIRPDRIAIRIFYENGNEGVIATLTGLRRPMTNGSLLNATIRRPLGAFRTIALIYWQALVLRLKGARYRTRPIPPKKEVS